MKSEKSDLEIAPKAKQQKPVEHQLNQEYLALYNGVTVISPKDG